MLIRVLLVRSGRVELPLSAPEANVLSTGLRARFVHWEQKIVYHETHQLVNLRCASSGGCAHAAASAAAVLDEVADVIGQRGEHEVEEDADDENCERCGCDHDGDLEDVVIHAQADVLAEECSECDEQVAFCPVHASLLSVGLSARRPTLA